MGANGGQVNPAESSVAGAARIGGEGSDAAERFAAMDHEELVGADGTALLSFDEFWDAYRRFTWSGFVMAVLASMIVGQTDRGDEMFVTMANRHASQVVDLEAVEFLNES